MKAYDPNAAVGGLLGAPPPSVTQPPVSPLLGAKLLGKGVLAPGAAPPTPTALGQPAPIVAPSAPPPPAFTPFAGPQTTVNPVLPPSGGPQILPPAQTPPPAPALQPLPAFQPPPAADAMPANVQAMKGIGQTDNPRQGGVGATVAPLPSQPLPPASPAPAPQPTPETVAASTPAGETPTMPNPVVPPVANPPQAEPIAPPAPILQALGPPPPASGSAATPAYVQTQDGADAVARINAGTIAAADPNAGLTDFGPGNDLRATQIAPAASDRLIGFGQQTNRARDLAAQSLEGLVNTPDRQALAKDALNNYIASTEADYKRRQQEVARRAASLGRIGSGMTADDVMRLGNSRDQEIVQKAAELANSTAGQQFADQQARLASSLNAGSQFGAAEGDQASREALQRNELRSERGYQGDMAQQAIANRAAQAALEASLQGQAFNQNLARANYGNTVAGAFDAQGQDAQTAAADAVRQQALLQALGMTGVGAAKDTTFAPTASVGSNGLPPVTAGLTPEQIQQILYGGL